MDEEKTRHLKVEIVQNHIAPLMSVRIADFPNEAGYFMLWKLSISDKESGKRIIPLFVNDSMVLCPMAGKRIMDPPFCLLHIKFCSNSVLQSLLP